MIKKNKQAAHYYYDLAPRPFFLCFFPPIYDVIGWSRVKIICAQLFGNETCHYYWPFLRKDIILLEFGRTFVRKCRRPVPFLQGRRSPPRPRLK